MSATKVLGCDCHHATQDEMYGAGRRVHNETLIKGAVVGQFKWRCTVCQHERYSHDLDVAMAAFSTSTNAKKANNQTKKGQNTHEVDASPSPSR